MQLAPVCIQARMPYLAMSSAMTWTVRLPTRQEPERFWQLLRWLQSLFTPAASWFGHIALYATLELCGSHQLIRWDVKAPPTFAAGSLKDSTMVTKAAAERQVLGAARLINTQCGYGPVQFAGTSEALYERHLPFDSDVDLAPELFPGKVAIQINDTHPAQAVPELMRILVYQLHLGWDQDRKIAQNTLAYTNHTLLPKAHE